MSTVGLPKRQGLYDPQHEHDSCGVGFLVHLKGDRSHKLIRDAITALNNLSHRGACGCEVNTGDGAGVLIQIPHEFLSEIVQPCGFELPERGAYGVGCLFFPKKPEAQEAGKRLFESIVAGEGQIFLGSTTIATGSTAARSVAAAISGVRGPELPMHTVQP